MLDTISYYVEISGLKTCGADPTLASLQDASRLDADLGVPGATAGKCAVNPVAQNITFLPGSWRVHNAWKINAHIKANLRGFLATL